VPFYEFFDGDTGRGCGAAHQTGWTALVTLSLDQMSVRRQRVEAARLEVSTEASINAAGVVPVREPIPRH